MLSHSRVNDSFAREWVIHIETLYAQWLIHMWMTHSHEIDLCVVSHVTYEWVTSHMNESHHIWMSHVTYEWATSHVNATRHVWMRLVTHEYVITHLNESWVMTRKSFSCKWVNHMWMQMHRLSTKCVVCCSVLQYVAVCCSVLQCVAVCCSVLHHCWLHA